MRTYNWRGKSGKGGTGHHWIKKLFEAYLDDFGTFWGLFKRLAFLRRALLLVKLMACFDN